MFRTASRRTHRAPGRAVIDYRGLAAPVGRSVGGVAALGAVTATAAITGSGVAQAETPASPIRPGTVTAPLPVISLPSTVPALRPALPTSVSLRVGARGNAVSALQQALNDHGASIGVDGIFGARTDQAVRSLQRSQGLAVDGIVGPRTWGALSGDGPASTGGGTSAPAPAAPSSTGTPNLRIGARGDAVVTLQNALRSRGAGFSATGYFGSQTQAAVRSFQASAGLAVDGIVGARTWAALNGDGGSVSTPAPSDGGSSSTGGSSSGSGSSGSSVSGNGSSIVSLAQSQVGTSYVFGASNPSVGFDCSGLVQYVYAEHGISVPRTARQQVYGGRIISESEAQPGDLVGFSAGNYGHIGIYAGNGMIVDASGSGRTVKYRSIWNAPHVFVTYR